MTIFSELPIAARLAMLGAYDQGGLDLDALADELGMSSAANLGRRIRELRATLRDLEAMSAFLETQDDAPANSAPVALLTDINLPTFDLPRYDHELQVETDNAIVLSDLHLPFYHRALAYAALAYAMRYNIRTCIWAGDTLDFDNVKYWIDEWAQDNRITEASLFRPAKRVIREFMRWFDSLYILMGNHEVRLNRATGGQIWMANVLDIEDDRVHFSRQHSMYIHMTNGERVWVCHPRNYSQIFGSVPKRLLYTQRHKCHVMIGHTHRAGVTCDESGHWALAELGCMLDPGLIQYVNLEPSTAPAFVPAFGVIHNRRVRVLRADEDWAFWLGDLYPQYAAALSPMRVAAGARGYEPSIAQQPLRKAA